MGTVVQCISPIDGSVYLEREALSPEAAMAAAKRARSAQASWAARPLAERVALVRAAVAEVGRVTAGGTLELTLDGQRRPFWDHRATPYLGRARRDPEPSRHQGGHHA